MLINIIMFGLNSNTKMPNNCCFTFCCLKHSMNIHFRPLNVFLLFCVALLIVLHSICWTSFDVNSFHCLLLHLIITALQSVLSVLSLFPQKHFLFGQLLTPFNDWFNTQTHCWDYNSANCSHGNLHFLPLIKIKTSEEFQSLRGVVKKITKIVWNLLLFLNTKRVPYERIIVKFTSWNFGNIKLCIISDNRFIEIWVHILIARSDNKKAYREFCNYSVWHLLSPSNTCFLSEFFRRIISNDKKLCSDIIWVLPCFVF